VGDEIRIIAGSRIIGYARSDFSAPLSDFGTNEVVGVVGARGVIESITGVEIVVHLLDAGLRFYEIPEGTFNQARPSTWGATDAATGLVLQAEISSYVLKDDEPVRQGNDMAVDPGPVFLDPGNVNRTAVNEELGAFTDGNGLFREVSDPEGFIDVETTDPFSPLDVTDEGLWITVDDFNVGTGEIAGYTAWSPADMAAANTIYDNLEDGLADGDLFALFGSGLATDYLPTGLPSINGDAAFRSTNAAAPGVQGQVIPEPSSVVLFSIMTAGLGLYSGVRRYRGQKVVVA
jgi:hypothetical protein